MPFGFRIFSPVPDQPSNRPINWQILLSFIIYYGYLRFLELSFSYLWQMHIGGHPYPFALIGQPLSDSAIKFLVVPNFYHAANFHVNDGVCQPKDHSRFPIQEDYLNVG